MHEKKKEKREGRVINSSLFGCLKAHENQAKLSKIGQMIGEKSYGKKKIKQKTRKRKKENVYFIICK